MEKIKLIVCGSNGRMGQRIISLAMANPKYEVVAGVDKLDSPKSLLPVKVTPNLSEVIKNCDIVIDFSSPEASVNHASICSSAGKPIVIGTTGLKEEELSKLREFAKASPVIASPNMSIGVNLLFKLAADVSKVLADYDIEIVELHHNQKKDSPSGTAEKLASIIASALGRDIGSVGVYGRKGLVGARKKDEIGVMAVRAGDIVGEHTVYYAGPGERIELTHRAHSRDTFAQGALVAALWLVKKKNGLFDMQDVLGLK
jgi:4-hydroxy-tetrahydrodipicolinate reductase